MASSLLSRAIRNVEEHESVFARLKEEDQDGEIDDHQWPQYKPSQLYNQRHSKLWNAVCFLLGTLLGVGGLFISQQLTVRSVADESIRLQNPVIPHSKYSIASNHVVTDDRQYQW